MSKSIQKTGFLFIFLLLEVEAIATRISKSAIHLSTHPLTHSPILPSIHPPTNHFIHFSPRHLCCLEQSGKGRQVPASWPLLSGMDGWMHLDLPLGSCPPWRHPSWLQPVHLFCCYFSSAPHTPTCQLHTKPQEHGCWA